MAWILNKPPFSLLDLNYTVYHFSMSFRSLRTLLALGLLFAATGITPASSAVKAGAACTHVKEIRIVSGYKYTCIKSGKKLVWSKGVKVVVAKPTPTPTPSPSPTPTPTPTPSSSPSTPTAIGDPIGSIGGTNNGSAGQGTSPTQQQQMPPDTEFLYGRRIGMNCSTNGVFGFTGGMLAVCKDKRVVYALESDLPATPAGGYKSRPRWYPSLAQQFGKMAEPTCSPSSIKFTSPVIPLDSMAPSVPYGAMIGGHVTPIDHAYLGVMPLYKDAATRTEADYVPITSPTSGVITEIGNLGSPTSIRVVIDHGCDVATVYMVLNRLSGVLAPYAEELKSSGASKSVRIAVKAGEEFGRQRDNMLDFNVWDGTQWLSGFANPFSYTSGEAWKPFTADPLPFFTDSIRAVMESNMQKTTSPRFGKIDYDIPGTASGSWFLDGTFGYSGRMLSEIVNATSELMGGQVQNKNEVDWSHLAIAPHEVDSTQWIFSTGWWKDPAGDPHQFMFNLENGKTAPDKLTFSSGMVVYQLVDYSVLEPAGSPIRLVGNTPFAVGYTLSLGMPRGVVALQVNSDGSLRVEVNTSMTKVEDFTAFTSARRIYRH